MTFDVSKLTVESITEDADYFGRRAKFIGWLGGTRLPYANRYWIQRCNYARGHNC